MAEKKITDLTNISEIDGALDVMAIVHVSTDETMNISPDQIFNKYASSTAEAEAGTLSTKNITPAGLEIVRQIISPGMVIKPSYLDNGDNTITIGSGAYNLNVSADGNGAIHKYVIAGNTFTVPEHQSSYIVSNYNDGTPVIQLITDYSLIDSNTILPIFTLYRQGTSIDLLEWDELGINLSTKCVNRFMQVDNIGRESGLVLTYEATRKFVISEGVVWYGTKQYELDEFTIDGTNCTLREWTYTTAGGWASRIVTQYDNTYYQGTSAPVLLDTDSYGIIWIYKKISTYDPLGNVAGYIFGKAQYDKLADAQNALKPTNSEVPQIFVDFGVLVGRIIFEASIDVPIETSSSFSVELPNGMPNHEDLLNLQGGTSSQYYHLTKTQHDTLTDGSNSDSLHTHSILNSLQLGKDGTSGQLRLFSEQGTTDYTATIHPNSAMTENASFYLPSAKPASTYHLTMTSGGVMGYDTTEYVATSGDQTIAGVKTFSSFPVTPSSSPSSNYQIANKAYVDLMSAGLVPKDSCKVSTTTALSACTYSGTPNFTLTGDSNGALGTIDDITLSVGNRILVKNQSTQSTNGIYTVTQLGDSTSVFILTRATDYDTTTEVKNGTFCYIEDGTTNKAYQFVQTYNTPTLDTDPLTFTALYAPILDTLDSVTDRGATTTNAITLGGLTNTSALYESGIKIITYSDTPYTIASADTYIHCNASSGAINVILPAATGSGRILHITKRDSSSNIITITADTSGTADLINGVATKALENQYDTINIQDYTANSWANIAKSPDMDTNTYRVSAGGRADFKSITDCLTHLATLTQTEGIRIVVDGGIYSIDSTISVNLTMPIKIEGTGEANTILTATSSLIGSNMFELTTQCDIEKVGFDGTVSGWIDGTNASFIKVIGNTLFCQFKGFIMDTCKKGIEVTGTSKIYTLDYIIRNSTVAGIELNAAGIAGLDSEIGNLESNAIGLHFLQSTACDIYLNSIRFVNATGNIAITYVPATLTYTNFNISCCEWNRVGTFLSGFDFTNSRDANIIVKNTAGVESKNPLAKINVVGNTTATTISTSNTWTLVTYTNTSYYNCKFTISSNRMTYQSDYINDLEMWISGSIYVSTAGTKTIQLAIIKNGTNTTQYGTQSVTLDTNGRKFNFSLNVYLQSVTKNDYFELYASNTSNTDDPVISDLTWLTKATA